jgi:hypothetical protein
VREAGIVPAPPEQRDVGAARERDGVKLAAADADEGTTSGRTPCPASTSASTVDATETIPMDAFAELARIADQIKDAIDDDRFAESIGDLRRALDLAFAGVLDHEQDPGQRAEFLDGFRSLTLSLDELERLHA